MTQSDESTSSLAATPIGEIAARLPGATAVFRSFKLDYCCGGRQTLASAVEKRGLDLLEVERSLGALDHKPVMTSDEPEEIIEFILLRYHDTHRRELRELLQLARRVEQVHADHPDAPKGLSEYLAGMAADLDSHMQKEEAILFPMIRARHPMVSAPIGAMEVEHDSHFASLARLEVLAHGMDPPAEACGSWRVLYLGLRKFSDDLKEHIHTENNILFPQCTDR